MNWSIEPTAQGYLVKIDGHEHGKLATRGEAEAYVRGYRSGYMNNQLDRARERYEEEKARLSTQ